MLNVITASTFRSRGFQINLSHAWWGCYFGFISLSLPKFLDFRLLFEWWWWLFGAARSENIVCMCIGLKYLKRTPNEPIITCPLFEGRPSFKLRLHINRRESCKFYNLTPPKLQILDSFESSLSRQCHQNYKAICNITYRKANLKSTCNHNHHKTISCWLHY